MTLAMLSTATRLRKTVQGVYNHIVSLGRTMKVILIKISTHTSQANTVLAADAKGQSNYITPYVEVSLQRSQLPRGHSERSHSEPWVILHTSAIDCLPFRRYIAIDSFGEG
eukprot:5294352-Amphidinium_carterae.1